MDAFWGRLLEDQRVRWTALAALPLVWLSIAWVDWRFLLGIPLAGFAVAGWFRWRGERDDDEFADWM